MWDRFAEFWCRNMHSKTMWPIHGKYICPDCLREYPVAWEELREPQQHPERPRPSVVWSFKRSDTM
jgi:hypothetical protein